MPCPPTPNDYDAEPVRYCKKCYSLKIKYEEAADSDCCMDCGCSDTAEAPIEEWERLYEKRYGKKYVTKEERLRKSLIFKMSPHELKVILYASPNWYDIIHTLYPKFPGGLGREDSVVLLFDRIAKDGKYDDLRLLLTKYSNF